MPCAHPYNKQSGNILVYILGAVFLLGVLTVMVRGSSTPGGGIDEEALIIRASEIQEYGQELERAISYIYQNGHSEADIRFAHPNADSAYGVITDIPTRQVFHRDGGGATYRAPPTGIQTTLTPWIFNGRNNVNFIGSTDGTGGNTTSTELLALLSNVTIDFCMLINEKNNIPNPLEEPPQDNNFASTAIFSGDFLLEATLDAPGLEGKMEGCFEGDSTPPAGTYHYYRVLLPR